MLKQYFTDLAAYNSWADEKAMDWLSQITDEQWEQVNVSSFSSIRQTAVHIASAEKIWIDFWTGAPDPVYLSANFNGTKTELMDIWKAASIGLEHYINSHLEEDFMRSVSFIYPNGNIGQMPYYQTFAHIVNHSTYHRGQLVTLLRQAGYSRFSSIDLATYYILKTKDFRS
ncbi:DinB family protein [Pedobacter sp. KBS0701]|uniref:DinB family protein n=1 Tax=unclassified Pedobacter TaxID=2628915 RepID=UPI00110EDEEF|nr:DinB family protein [Pedobacter sp. KBS0701]QDW27893.1 damage-inducible protein DinB [Pedobacter sp. KBS0701]